MQKATGSAAERGRSARSGTHSRKPGSWNESVALLQSSRPLLERILFDGILRFWDERVVDGRYGGYRLNHDVAGRYAGPHPRHVVAQARTLWYFARLGRLGLGEGNALEAARHGYDYLRRRLWDDRHGGFFWQVHADGRPLRPHKHALAVSFALYGLAEYAKATGDAGVERFLAEAFRCYDRHAHDPVHGGYREMLRSDWGTPEDLVGYWSKDPRLKTLASHLHLLEAYSSCLEVTSDPLMRERLGELVRIVTRAAHRPECHPADCVFRTDWSPAHEAPRRVEYGASMKRIWYVSEALALLGESDDSCRSHWLELYDEALRFGSDPRDGGFHLSGEWGGPAANRHKQWWVQAEALVGSLAMLELDGSPRFAAAFLDTLDWIAARQVDWTRGGWHHTVAPCGRVSGGKAGDWKTPYHTTRAILESLHRVERLGPTRAAGQSPV
jgi:mannose/cellobiose epimerase-like protein (N-acyl-D-glucosamine 2-epimerase family)